MRSTSYFDKVSSIWFPTVLVTVVGYFIGKIFASVYLTACYGILQSFYVDVELNKGSDKPPKNTPTELKEFVERAKSL